MSWTPKPPVVVPVDFSGEEVEAVKTAIRTVDDQADVHLLHVLYPLDIVSPGVIFGDVSDEDREQAVMQKLEDLATSHGWSDARRVVRIGEPGVEVPRYAEEAEAGLIVVPSHGYGGFRRFLLGSVAERIIRNATCHVLVLRRSDAM